MGGMEGLAERWLEKNVTVDSHFSGNWLDVKLREWASGTHEKSSDEERTWRKDGRRGQAGEHCYSIHISQKMCRILDDQKESLHIVKPSGFYVCFYVSFLFSWSLCFSQERSNIHPSKRHTKPGAGTQSSHWVIRKTIWSFAPDSSKEFLFCNGKLFPVVENSWLFCWEPERNRQHAKRPPKPTDSSSWQPRSSSWLALQAPQYQAFSHITLDLMRFNALSVRPQRLFTQDSVVKQHDGGKGKRAELHHLKLIPQDLNWGKIYLKKVYVSLTQIYYSYSFTKYPRKKKKSSLLHH